MKRCQEKKAKKKKELTLTSIFDRVVSILEQAKTNVVRTVNNEMVLVYWHIGREIVQAIHVGAKRAAYGKEIIKELSGSSMMFIQIGNLRFATRLVAN